MNNDGILYDLLCDLGVSPYLSALSENTKRMIFNDLRAYLVAKPFEDDFLNTQLDSYNRMCLNSSRERFKQLEIDFPAL